jgi:hypothetical protein
MPKISGTIDAVYENDVKGYGGKMKKAFRYSINGAYYSGGFKRWAGEKGDEVTIDYETNAKGYNDIKEMWVTGKGSVETRGGSAIVKSNIREFPVGPLAPERAINRQNALTNAVKYAEGEHLSVDDVIEIARKFEAYTTGDMDRANALLSIANGEEE